MTLQEAEELILEYQEEWKRLLRIGEKKYGSYCGFNDGAGQFADERIKLNPRYTEWAIALDLVAKEDARLYEEYCKANPVSVRSDSCEQQMIDAIGHYLQFRTDVRIIKTLKEMVGKS